MDWFERITGFRESSYAETRRRLEVVERELVSRETGRRWGVGELELVSLASLRERVQATGGLPGRLKASIAIGDVRAMHRKPELAGALFQVASQFNLLEMVSPRVGPEEGVTGYEHDLTQGPACAIAAGAATIYRNYFVPVGDGIGQTATRQLDGLADLGTVLSERLGRPVGELWTMQNGYALCSRSGLEAITSWLASASPPEIDSLRGTLRIGLHRDVEVTDAPGPQRPRVAQAFCSALPVAYGGLPSALWQAFGLLVLEAACEATLLAAVLEAQRGASRTVLLTRLGGGAFGNDEAWIDAAMRRAFRLARGFALDVRVVSYGEPSPALRQLLAEAAAGT